MTTVSPSPKFQAFDANGAPLVGGKLYTYAAGTTTPQTTYTNQSGAATNTNPVILDSRGEASVWLSSAQYKFVLKDADDVEIWSVDYLTGSATQAEFQALTASVAAQIAAISSDLAASSGSSLVGYAQAGLGATTQTVQSRLRKSIYVTDFGAVGNGVADDTTPFTLAIQQAAAIGGADVIVPPGKYLISPITLPSYVNLVGATQGPFDGAASLSPITAPTILTTNTLSPLITLAGYQNSVSDLLFYYPSQTAPTGATPIAYPSTVKMMTAGGHACRRCTFVNSYTAIQLQSTGRCYIEDCIIGAYYRGIAIDNVQDVVYINNCYMGPIWDIYAGLNFPQTIDIWTMTYGIGLEAARMDSLMVDGFFVLAKWAGFSFIDSPDTTLTPYRNGYGVLNNVDLDTVAYGVYAISTNAVADGYKFTNLVIGANNSGIGTAAQVPMYLAAGGTDAPRLTWTNGSVRGTWVSGYPWPAIVAGTAYVENVRGINDLGSLAPYAPAVAASGVAVNSPFPFATRVNLVPVGAAITGVSFGGAPSGLAGSTPLPVVLRPLESITVTYGSVLGWSWYSL